MPAFDAARVRFWRARAGLTQAAMAEAIGLSLRQYNELERGAAPIRKLHRMAMAAVLHEISDPETWEV